MAWSTQSGGDTAPAADDRERASERVYRRGKVARRRQDAGKLWVQPHYPADDSDMAQAWLEGWEDMGDELALEAGKRGAA